MRCAVLTGIAMVLLGAATAVWAVRAIRDIDREGRPR